MTESRTRLDKFISKHQHEHWIDVKDWAGPDYYAGLSEYKFATCPTGTAFTGPKIYEAILVRTIPIVEDELVFRQLKNMGIPLLIINTWDDLSYEFLVKKYNQMKIDWEKAIYLCSVDGASFLINKYGF